MKKNILVTICYLASALASFAQKENTSVRNGNKLYKQSQFQESIDEYKKAVTQKPDNPIANYNLGNAQFRTNQLEESVRSYDATINNSDQKPVREKAFYNKGVAFSKQQKLQESIEAWKNALKLDSEDEEARENLQKALLEQKKQQPKNEKKTESKEKKKQDSQNKKDKEKQPPPPEQKQSKLTKKQVEQLLKALAQKEKEVQQKLQSKNASPSRQEKDW